MPTVYLPTSEEHYKQLKEAKAVAYINCVFCKKPFSGDNVKTLLGWRETQITGSCETCFDNLFKE